MPDITVTVRAEHGRFRARSFEDLLQRQVVFPGLDPAWTHVLTNVEVSDDGAAAVMTTRSEPRAALSLDQTLRVVTGAPPAAVRLHDGDGALLGEVRLAAPLYDGQPVEYAGRQYHVRGAHWPNRDPATGRCAGDVDWQHVQLDRQPDPVFVPALDDEPTPT